MSWLTDIISGSGTKDIVEAVGNTVDQLVTSDEERMMLKNDIKKAEQNYKLEMEKLRLKGIEIEKDLFLGEQAGITDRWKSDMTSDNWLSKNVRPLVLLIFTGLIVVMAVGGQWLEIQSGMADLVKTLGIVVFGAYFGGRSFEKVQKIVKSRVS